MIANALGFAGSVQQLFNIFRLEGVVDVTRSAFRRPECEAAAGWVHDGGSLLLVADHAPAGKAASELAAVFGVGMTNGYAEDGAPYHDSLTGHWGFLVFSEENGLLGRHPIIRGRNETEAVRRVVTFTGQALRSPPGSTVLLRLSPSARDYPRRQSDNDAYKPAGGLAQAVALEYGRGRVVVLGEAACITSQKAGRPPSFFHFGLDWPDSDNRTFALNIMRWLTRVLG